MKRWLAIILTAVLVWTSAGVCPARAAETGPDPAATYERSDPEAEQTEPAEVIPEEEPAAEPPSAEDTEQPIPETEAPEEPVPEPPAEVSDEQETQEVAEQIQEQENPDSSEGPEITNGLEMNEEPEEPEAVEEPAEPEEPAKNPDDLPMEEPAAEEPVTEAPAIEVPAIGESAAEEQETEPGQEPDVPDTDQEEAEAPDGAEETTEERYLSDKTEVEDAPVTEGSTKDETEEPAEGEAETEIAGSEFLTPEEGETVAEFEVETEWYLPETEGDDAEALLRAYIEKLLKEAMKRPGLLRSIRVDDGRLDEVCLALYQTLKPQIESIASGAEDSTEFSVGYGDLGLPTSFTASELGLVINNKDDARAGVSVVAEQVRVNYALVQLALLANCPYELYWYDKSQGAKTTASPAMRVVYRNGEYVYEITSDYSVRMTVSADYKADTYKVDTSVSGKARHAVQTARQIVEKYRDLNDLEKLEAYRDEICRLVSYNGSASGTQSYGDPWQLVYVFDEDGGTNVVCEGYAKAFQYLCDMSDFDGDVNCYTVQGRMDWGVGEGTHMWNIVTMSDGQNYLVDLTNSDAGTLGADGSLFLTGGAEEDAEGRMTFYNDSGRAIRYEYNKDTVTLYTEKELTLAGGKFEVTCHLDLYPYHTMTEKPLIRPTCAESGRQACWYCEEDRQYYSDARGTAELSEEELVIPALGHAYGEWAVTTEPTCTKDGAETRVCAHDETHVETRSIPASGHQLKEVPEQKPTYTREGWISHWVCGACGSLFADEEAAVPLDEKDIIIPKKKRPVKTAETFIAMDAGGINALLGWRIAGIEEVLSGQELEQFNDLTLYQQLSVLAAVLTQDMRAVDPASAAGLANQLTGSPDRRADFIAVFPESSRSAAEALPSPAYEVLLIHGTDTTVRRLVLIAVDSQGSLQVMAEKK